MATKTTTSTTSQSAYGFNFKMYILKDLTTPNQSMIDFLNILNKSHLNQHLDKIAIFKSAMRLEGQNFTNILKVLYYLKDALNVPLNESLEVFKGPFNLDLLNVVFNFAEFHNEIFDELFNETIETFEEFNTLQLYNDTIKNIMKEEDQKPIDEQFGAGATLLGFNCLELQKAYIKNDILGYNCVSFDLNDANIELDNKIKIYTFLMCLCNVIFDYCQSSIKLGFGLWYESGVCYPDLTILIPLEKNDLEDVENDFESVNKLLINFRQLSGAFVFTHPLIKKHYSIPLFSSEELPNKTKIWNQSQIEQIKNEMIKIMN